VHVDSSPPAPRHFAGYRGLSGYEYRIGRIAVEHLLPLRSPFVKVKHALDHLVGIDFFISAIERNLHRWKKLPRYVGAEPKRDHEVALEFVPPKVFNGSDGVDGLRD